MHVILIEVGRNEAYLFLNCWMTKIAPGEVVPGTLLLFLEDECDRFKNYKQDSATEYTVVLCSSITAE